MDRPIYPQAFVGFRGWLPSRGLLLSEYSFRPWRPGINVAICDRAQHLPPDPDCSCGLYASNTLRPQRDLMMGVIAARGDVHVHASGFRAEEAVVIALAPSTDQRLYHGLEEAHRIAERYGVPLVNLDELEQIADRTGAIPQLQHMPVPRRDDDESASISGVQTEWQRLRNEAQRRTYPPPGPLLDLVYQNDLEWRLRSLLLLAIRESQSPLTREEIVHQHWPHVPLLAQVNRKDSESLDTRMYSDLAWSTKKAQVFLRQQGLIKSIPRAGSLYGEWYATDAGRVVRIVDTYTPPRDSWWRSDDYALLRTQN